ncbi:aldolase [Paraburkholderia hospita]|uniref:aldolase n=1 Tax=Paraburkholderia hospita TaxID=169430 RepID=UPI000DEF575A|nr:aldolase [Paraburkholderia hospita]AXF05909.1 aldolase [Paraburkholderia hospita]
MAKTLNLSKTEIVARSLEQMNSELSVRAWTSRQKLALTCRTLFDGGHDSGLAGQITCRAEDQNTFYTQPFGYGFDEITPSNLLLVDQDLKTLDGQGMPNPANGFHTWIYRARAEVNCIIHTHPLHVSALSMLEVPLEVSHMDICPLHEDCAFLEKWPGVPVGNEEGEIISAAIGDKRAILLAHHGMLVTGETVEEACILALLMERAARLQLAAMQAGTIKPIPQALAKEAHDWTSTPKRHAVVFGYYARRALRNHPGCLD